MKDTHTTQPSKPDPGAPGASSVIDEYMTREPAPIEEKDISIEEMQAISDIETRKKKLASSLEAWKAQLDQERALRKGASIVVFALLAIEILLINLFFYWIGIGRMRIEPWMATSILMAAYAQIVTMALAVIKYLFPETGGDSISKIIGSL